MDTIYLLSPRLRTWTREGSSLYFDPQNFVWAKVNDAGAQILELCREFLTFEQLLGRIVEAYHLSEEKAEGILAAFLEQMCGMGLLHRNEYVLNPERAFGHRDFPKDVYLHVTDKCNLKCSYCYNKVDRTQKLKLERSGRIESTLSTAEMQALLRQLVSGGTKRILFTGGEALLRDDIVELLRYTRALSEERRTAGDEPVTIELLTNAILITEDIAEDLCDVVDTVTISLDGHEAHYHDVTRGRGTFDATVRGVRTLIATRTRRNQVTPHVCMVPVISEENVYEMPEIFMYALAELGADSLAPIIFQAGDHQEVSLAKVPSKQVFFQALAKTNIRLEEEGLAKPRKKRYAAAPRFHCGVGSAEISIDAHGTVYPCQSLHYDNFASGNVRTNSIAEILEKSPVMNMVRGASVDTLKVCSHCDLRYLCNGGCRATAYNLYHEFDRHNALYCSTLEEFAVNRLWASTDLTPELQEGLTA